MDKLRVTPKDFFLWAGAMISFYVSVFSFLALFFDYIDVAFPDSLNPYVDPYSSTIRFSIASLIVLFPVFLLLMYFIRRDIIAQREKMNLWVRRWALVLTIFVAGATLVTDLIVLVNTYLNGDITTHFVLKVLIVFLVMAAGLMHFLADMWGYWDENPRYLHYVAGAVGVLVVSTIVGGVFIIGTPAQVRMYRFDDQKVSDLQMIQSEIVSYWQSEGKLPANLSDLNDSINGFTVPTDAQDGSQYDYSVQGTTTFQLCANFNAPTQPDSPTLNQYSAPLPAGASGVDLSQESWYHGEGKVCFARTIDPKRYPPYPTAVKQ
ncbi:MAG TPA: DUF5671 domain-containing protein [Candidatus Paceibacterota bacterium]|nr:DUF5671 domain-containing protein [Candidatus Paceibacterota bacterium]